MKILKILLISFLLLGTTISYAQVPIQIEELTPDETNPPSNYNADTLKAWLQNILRGRGGMIDTNSIVFKGDYRAFGRFYDGSDVGFDKGLIISNGMVESAESPNNQGVKSDFFNTYSPFTFSGDSSLLEMYNTLLNSLLGYKTTADSTGDAAILEFTYRPFGDQIFLDYIFASEEYPTSRVPPSEDVDLTDWPNTPQIFDLFGISISGNGVFRNLAFTPPTQPGGPPPQPPEPQRWVTVQHINAGNNPSYYLPNPNLNQPLGTQFDGMTRPVGDLGPIHIQVNEATPCGYYDVKIVIEDFFWESPNEDVLPSGFQINSAIFLKENSLRSPLQLTNTLFSDWSVDHYFTNPDFEEELIPNCNHIVAIFTLEFPINQDYSIPFKVETTSYRDSVEVAYDGGDIITNDSITFLEGETEKIITISAVNINADHTNVSFQYPENPCDFPPPPPLYGGYSGKIYFDMRTNNPISFTDDPKIYSAYCKETIELTVTDITENGVTPLFYRWNNDVIPHDTINYQVQSNPDFVLVDVTDNCANASSVEVKINNKPIELNTIQDVFLCGPGQDEDITITASMPNYNDYSIDSVSWHKVESPNQFLGSAYGNVINVLYDNAVGPNIWTCGFTIFDCCGGTKTGTFLVNQSELSLGGDLNICNGDSIEIIANASAHWYKWYPTNDPDNILSDTNFVTVSPSFTTEYTLEIEDLCYVDQTATITVNVDQFVPQITINPSSAEICPGDEITISANSALEWHWSPGDETTQSISLNPTIPNKYYYTLTASSEYCIDKIVVDSFEVFPDPVAHFNFVPEDDACTGESINFYYSDVVTNETFIWDFNDGSSTSNETNPAHTYSTPGTYNVLLHVDKYICENDSSAEVTINPLPTPDFSADKVYDCLPVEVLYSDWSNDVAPGAEYEWTFGDGQTSDNNGNTIHTYNEAGLYTVSLTIHNTERCAQTITKPNLVQVNPNPDADFEADPWITTMDTPVIDLNDQSTSDSTIQVYEWDFGDGETSSEENPSHTYMNPGDYDIKLYIETLNGCWDTTFAKVALTEDVRLFIPNAFTPNGDGVNDVFEIKGTPITDFNLYIIDRWGSVIWSTHNYETKWDGTGKDGSVVSSGTYVYQISGTDYLLNPIDFKGTVTVIK